MVVCYDGRLYLRYRTMIGRARMCVIMHALTKSCVLDNTYIRELDEHDSVFTPQNIFEKEFWESSRAMCKKAMARMIAYRIERNKGPKEEVRKFYPNRKKRLQNEKNDV